MQRWVNEIPNDGLIRYMHLFNAERLLITSPKALGEVLVQKNYDFIKPRLVRAGLGRILGVGVLLAEGEEHKVGQDTSYRALRSTLHEKLIWNSRRKERTLCQLLHTDILKICTRYSGPSRASLYRQWPPRFIRQR